MTEDELNYDDIVDVWEREKDSAQPCALPKNFYERLRNYIQELKEQAEDIEMPPKDKREKRIQKQYERVKKIADHFFKERQKKVVLAAYHSSLGEKVNTENLIDRELELLEEISDLLTELKDLMFYGEYKPRTQGEVNPEEERVKEEGEDTSKESSSEEEEKQQEGEEGRGQEEQSPEVEATEDQESSPQKDSEQNIVKQEANAHEELLVHIIEDVPPFVDVDNAYELRKEDVVTLQEDIAKVLIERGKARKVKL